MTKSQKIKESIKWYIHNGQIDNPEMVELFEHMAVILNVKTRTQYAKDNKISYQGSLKRQVEKVKLNGIELIIDNE